MMVLPLPRFFNIPWNRKREIIKILLNIQLNKLSQLLIDFISALVRRGVSFQDPRVVVRAGHSFLIADGLPRSSSTGRCSRPEHQRLVNDGPFHAHWFAKQLTIERPAFVNDLWSK